MTSLYILLIFGSLVYADDVSDKLISAIVIFRHGDRAPTDRLSNQSYTKYFPNGLGELTNTGIENSYRLGLFLRDRYVTNGFLRTPLLPSQVYFRSKGNNRCLMSASLVAAGMFSIDEKPTTAAVPIYSQERNDNLLGGTIDCVAEVNRIRAKCGRTPRKHYKNFTEFEGFMYECLQLHKMSKLFHDGKSFEIVDSLLNERRNDLPMPRWFEEHEDEIVADFNKVENFILGVGEYHDADVLRIKSGPLLHSILSTLRYNWEQFLANGSSEKKKFVAYSTQDWLIQAFTESLGIRVAAMGEDQFPPYNSLIILELRKVQDSPVVKAFYRDPHTATLIDVTSSIRGCKGYIACPLELVLGCCQRYTLANRDDECYVKTSQSR